MLFIFAFVAFLVWGTFETKNTSSLEVIPFQESQFSVEEKHELSETTEAAFDFPVQKQIEEAKLTKLNRDAVPTQDHAWKIQGRVLAREGYPIPGAKVRLSSTNPNARFFLDDKPFVPPWPEPVVSDANGEFVFYPEWNFKKLDVIGKIWLEEQKFLRVAAKVEGFIPGLSFEFPRETEGLTQVDVVLDPGFLVSGRVVDEQSGLAVLDASISLVALPDMRRLDSGNTNSQGFFRFFVPTGEGKFIVRKRGFEEKRVQIVVENGGLELEIPLKKLDWVIRGKVRDASGQVFGGSFFSDGCYFRGYELKVYGENPLQVDADKLQSVEVSRVDELGNHNLDSFVAKADPGWTRAWLELDAIGERKQIWELTPSDENLELTVDFRAIQKNASFVTVFPVARKTGEAVGKRGGLWYVRAYPAGETEALMKEICRNEEGEQIICLGKPGIYDFLVFPPGDFARTWIRGVEVPLGSRIGPLRVELDESAKIRVQVHFEGVEPGKDPVIVEIFDFQSMRPMWFPGDEDGDSFLFGRLSTGLYRIHASCGDFENPRALGETTVEIVGPSELNVSVVLSPNRNVKKK